VRFWTAVRAGAGSALSPIRRRNYWTPGAVGNLS
jgi:hypothetical protein